MVYYNSVVSFFVVGVNCDSAKMFAFSLLAWLNMAEWVKQTVDYKVLILSGKLLMVWL